LLNILWIPFAWTSSPSSMPMILRFGLWMEWWVLTYSFHRSWVVLLIALQFFL
jgi:hypothetical protein